MEGTYLAHYASEYYDPVKAHEYYEEHKKLKGRSSLNEEGRIAADYIKKSLYDERDKKLEERENAHKSEIESRQAQVEQYKAQREQEMAKHTEEAQKKIDAIRERLDNASPSQRKLMTKALSHEIEMIRSGNNAQRQKVNEDISKMRENNSKKRTELTAKLREDKTTIKKDYESKYYEELDKLTQEAKYTAKKGKGSGSGSSKKSTNESEAFKAVKESIANRKKK